MRFRPPRFTLVLTALVALAALVIVLAGGSGPGTGSTAPPAQPTQTGPTTAVQACIKTGAQARETARATVAATERASVPLKVTQTVVGPRATVTATRGGSFVASVRATRRLAVTERAGATARQCARAPNQTAARALAVRRAYAVARTRARARAAAGARGGLRALERRTYPLVQAEARNAATRRAEASALAARPALIRAARREAAREAG